jgi:choloylglycine hydrolase
MGAMGLPGDFSSASRFVRAAFLRHKSCCAADETANVAQFFHILGGVAMPKGCVLTTDGQYEYTRYSCCCNTDTGVYYYMTYEDCALRRVAMGEQDLTGDRLLFFP